LEKRTKKLLFVKFRGVGKRSVTHQRKPPRTLAQGNLAGRLLGYRTTISICGTLLWRVTLCLPTLRRYSAPTFRATPAASILPIVHKVFSNIKAWLNGTYHGVSVKHLPQYLREWSYRFNRRGLIADVDHFLLRRAVGRKTITYGQLVGGDMLEGAA
jgi:hypothetical protein